MTTVIRAAAMSLERRRLAASEISSTIINGQTPEPIVSQIDPEQEDDPVVEGLRERVAQLQLALTTLETRTEAAEMKVEANAALIDRAVAEGREHGYTIGLEQGLKESRKHLAAQQIQFKQSFEKITEAINVALQTYIQQVAQDGVLEIAFAATTKLLGKVLVTRDGVAALVAEVLKQVMDTHKPVFVRLAAVDYRLLQEDPLWLEHFNSVHEVQIVADHRVSVGGCIVESKAGLLDARLEVQLTRFMETLLEVRRQQQRKQVS